MKKWDIVSLLLVSVLIFGIATQLPGADDYSNFKGRAISLKVLQQQVKDFQGKGSMPTTLYQLCGITQIHGYMVDEANKDIILIGSIERDKPPLYLDDFVIAMRNAWMKYAELKGNTNYYSNPGCSIDPEPAVMGKLDEIGNRLKESQTLDQTEAVIRQWESVCDAPQKVRVMGIPFNSHFAWVMVKADYDMKKIADGTDELNLLCFSTLADLQMEEAKKQHIHGHAPSGTTEGMNRFWFSPGEYRFLEDDNAVMIETCKVKLLTEEEHLTSKGDIAGKGRPNPVAEKFVNDFSDFYHEVAVQRPIYQELENLFRFVALAKAMKLKAPHEQVGLSLEYLLEQYPVSGKKVETSLPGRSNVNRYKRQMQSVEGSQVSQLWLPSCGGVSMDVDPKPQDFKQDKTDTIKNMQKDAIKEKTSSDQLSWNIGEKSNEVHILIKRKVRSTKQRYLDCTIGELYVNGEKFCKTLELPFKNAKNYESSVPVVQNHNAQIKYSEKHKGWIIELDPIVTYVYDEKDPFLPRKEIVRSSIQIHSGNKPKHTEGCILLGDKDYKGRSPFRVYKSRDTLNKLLEDYFNGSKNPDQSIKISVTIQTDY